MMFHFPFSPYSYYRKPDPYSYYSGSPPIRRPIQKCIPEPVKEEPKCSPKIEERDFFEILGIRLYFDDILLISLLFFLYHEEVEDQSLFFALVFLLLS